jgi:hypothetical protein
MKQSHKITPAADAIEAIDALTSEEELAAFVTHDETRKTVLKAADEKYAELSAPAAAPEEVDLESKPEEDAPESEQSPEDENDEQAGEVVSIDPELREELHAAVADKVDEEKKRFINEVLPDGDVTAKLEAAAAAIGQEAEVPATAFDAFVAALANQVTMDRNKRGLSQANAIDLALEELHEAFNAE